MTRQQYGFIYGNATDGGVLNTFTDTKVAYNPGLQTQLNGTELSIL